MNEVLITILFKNNLAKGILGPNSSYPNTTWWDKEMHVSVPKADWEAEKITVETIRKYIR
jgi:hypothetical protein